MCGGVDKEVALERKGACRVGLGAGKVKLQVRSFGPCRESRVCSTRECQVGRCTARARIRRERDRAGCSNRPPKERCPRCVEVPLHRECLRGRRGADAEKTTTG